MGQPVGADVFVTVRRWWGDIDDPGEPKEEDRDDEDVELIVSDSFSRYDQKTCVHGAVGEQELSEEAKGEKDGRAAFPVGTHWSRSRS